MKRKPQGGEDPRLLLDAMRAIEARSQTLGSCEFCEWPITHTYYGHFGEMRRYCDLCIKFTDTLMCRQFWPDYPDNVI